MVDHDQPAGHRVEGAMQLELLGVAPAARDEGLRSMSVSSIVQLARCPKQFYWTVVRPLPRRSRAVARLGQEIHRWIELRSVGQGRLDDPEGPRGSSAHDLPDRAVGEGLPSPEALKRAFELTPYARLRPRFTEQPFVIALEGGFLVRGRIDAVYVHDDGTWEIVDYKTGSRPVSIDRTAKLQLAVYALGARHTWGMDAHRLRVSYVYLGSGDVVTNPATDLALEESDLVETFERLASGDFPAVPGALCGSCDFLGFCPSGRAHVAAAGSVGSPEAR